MDSGEHVLVANAGTLHVFKTAAQLLHHGLLKRCVTSLYFRDDAFRYVPKPLREPLVRSTSNRRCAELAGFVDTMPWPEIACLVARAAGVGSHREWIEWRNRRFCTAVAKRHLDDVRIVWAFDTCSYEIFTAAKARRIACVLDMSTAHPAFNARLMTAYLRKRPNLARYLDAVVPEPEMARRRAEMKLADHIVVASRLVRDSLTEEGIDPAIVTINPYGVELEKFRGRSGSRQTGSVRFLFVGWFSAHKGVFDLLEAWTLSRLADRGAELVLAGGSRSDLSWWPGPLPDGVTLAGRVPHAALPELYASADVFVFPSLFEGFGRVILEAMASGLPVITTPDACDDTRVVDGYNGFRVPAADSPMLAERMRQLAGDAGLRSEMGARASASAQQYTWSAYGERCATACRTLLDGAPC